MAEFQELIKNFERIRDYMRQFFVYGFKVRGDYNGKSARTYDNERRRIESLLGNYTQSGYTAKGKKVYVTVNSKSIPQNPLYAAWKSKSFTDNDILLHFFLPALLSEYPEGCSAGEAAEKLSLIYGAAFDAQIVRLKLKEYEALGIFTSHKEGRELKYHLKELLPMEAAASMECAASTECAASMPGTPAASLWEHLITAITFFQGDAPFGIIGSTILDRENISNTLFQFKHQFIVHTLEDGVLLHVLEAIQTHRSIRFENQSHRSGLFTTMSGIPLRIFVSTQTGRRYLCLYQTDRRRFQNVRLDSMAQVQLLEEVPDYDDLIKKLNRNLPHCFGVSFGGYNRMEELQVRLYIQEQKEKYVLERLKRESRGGEVTKVGENEYLYHGFFYDTNEMLTWIKTFTGRILDIQGSNSCCISKIISDWNKMYRMYCVEESEDYGAI